MKVSSLDQIKPWFFLGCRWLFNSRGRAGGGEAASLLRAADGLRHEEQAVRRRLYPRADRRAGTNQKNHHCER